MTNEFLQKILDVSVNIHQALTNINQNFEPIPLWQNLTFFSVVVSAVTLVVLFFTLRWARRYALSTEILTRYQIMPSIDVKMIYNQTAKKTYFWFSNDSKLPGWINVKYKRNGDEVKNALDLRIPPDEKGIKTADSFFWNAQNDEKITLYASIRPAFKKLGLESKTEFEKSYRFNGQRNTWDDASWGYPVDRPFPFPLKTKKCSECKSEIDSEAKKCRHCYSVLKDNEI